MDQPPNTQVTLGACCGLGRGKHAQAICLRPETQGLASRPDRAVVLPHEGQGEANQPCSAPCNSTGASCLTHYLISQVG